MRTQLLFGIVGSTMLALGCAQSDAGITTSVKTRFAADDVVKARQIDVDTRDRVVTLSGQVQTPQEEARAIQIARDTDGVADVVDQLEVVPESAMEPATGAARPAPDFRADAGITAEVKAKLVGDNQVQARNIDVDTKDNVVTLTGTVRSEGERSRAIDLAYQVEGVKGVNDKLTVEAR
jgi:hyperosmotically inducible protein